jgi:uncharacterized protein YndB with AHSA1/START domain
MRSHTHQIELNASAENVFSYLHTPGAIRAWWGAARAIVIPRQGGTWAAAWGDEEDSPDYITSAVIQVFDRPKRLIMGDFNYFAKSGPLPFEANLSVEFVVEPTSAGCLLRVVQTGFPDDLIADDFYNGCGVGWKNTFEGIRSFVKNRVS